MRLAAEGIELGLALARGEQALHSAAGDGREAAAAGGGGGNGREAAAAGAEAAAAGRCTRLVDLFCGAGLFGVSLAATGRFASVLGLELGSDAVRSAG